MLKRKTVGVLLFLALVCAGAGALLLKGEKAYAAKTPSASLFLPESYEEYLELNEPVDAAFSDNHIAIADGKTLFLYDRKTGRYSECDVPEDNGKIAKIGFAEERLFVAVRASSNVFYEYNFSNETLVKLSINCSTFCISDGTLYTANVGGTNGTTIASYSVAQLSMDNPSSEDLGMLTTASTPTMTKLGDILYCTINDQVYHINATIGEKFSTTSESFYISLNTSDTKNVHSTCAHDNAFYYTADGGLYRAEFSANDSSAKKATCVLEGNNFKTLTSYDGSLYCIQGTSIHRLGFGADGQAFFTDYEIGSSSNSVNRLNSAKDSVRAGNLLVTADTGNNRLSVYDMETQSYAAVALPFAPSFAATDGSLVAAANDKTIHVFTRNYDGDWQKQQEFKLTDDGDKIKGIACVFGKVYYVSEHKRGAVGGNAPLSSGTPTGIAADLYGDLFVSYSNNSVKKFTEETFLQSSASGETTDITLPATFFSLRADFEGNLYYLDTDGALCRCGENEPLAQIDGKDYVYSKDNESIKATTFALGFEDDEVYFCYGNFIVKTDKGQLGFPTLDTIPAESVFAEIGRVHDKEEVIFTDVEEGVVGVRIDLGALTADSEYFPYSSYERTETSSRGVLLAETGGYRLVAFYNDRSYRVELFRTASTGEALSPVLSEGGEPLYLLNDTYLYHYPALVEAHSEEPARRGEKFRILAVLSSGDGDEARVPFAFVERIGNERAAERGYLPLTFLNAADPNGETADDYFLGDLLPKEDGIVFTAEDGETLTLTERTQVRLYENGDGTYTARYTGESGKIFTATVEEGDIDRGESDALRIALIVILTVLAVVIIGAYVYLLPKKKNKKERGGG